MRNLILLVLLVPIAACAQPAGSKWDKEEMTVTIDSINQILRNNYVFPEVADRMAESIKSNLQSGKYNSIANPGEFARQLTADLQSVSRDKHLRVNYSPQLIAAERNAVTAEERAKRESDRVAEMRRDNFGFQEIRVLDGNIGYLDLRAFMEPKYAGETAVAAMNFLSNTDAMIIDLRDNGGGSPAMIQLITSYFYPSEPVHLNNFYYRPANETTQTWTLPHVPGIRRPDVKLFILTSSDTFSAAEEFSYNLKNLERATLIGETTGGGAHPTGSVIATDKFFVRVPKGRAINPVTNTNWEGTGVTPHIKVAAHEALTTAHIKALEHLRSATSDSSAVQTYKWIVDGLNAKTHPVKVDAAILKSYAGMYGKKKVSLEDGTLRYENGDGEQRTLIPISADVFVVEGISYYRIRFLKEQNKVVALLGMYRDGGTERVEKNHP